MFVVVVTVVTRFVRYDAYKSSLFVLYLVKFMCIHLFFWPVRIWSRTECTISLVIFLKCMDMHLKNINVTMNLRFFKESK